MASILLKEKIHEALASVVPITLIVLALSFSLAPLPLNIMALFIGGAVLLILGMGLFSLGVDIAMSPMGEAIGVSMTRTRKVGLVLAISFFIGLIITVAEPDLQVLAEQVSDIPNLVLVLTVGVGVGVFLVVAMLRILFNVPLRFMLLGFYGLVFLLSAFTPGRFIPLAFDAGGVTTGPITVPFILALGIGVASIRSDKNSHDDSFGLVALCSIGPILSVMLLGVIFRPDSAGVQTYALVSISTTGELALQFLHAFPHYCREVALAVGPIALVFFLYNFLARRFRRRSGIFRRSDCKLFRLLRIRRPGGFRRGRLAVSLRGQRHRHGALLRGGRIGFARQLQQRGEPVARGALLETRPVHRVADRNQRGGGGAFELRQRDDFGDHLLLRHGAEQKGEKVGQNHSGQEAADAAAELVDRSGEGEIPPRLRMELLDHLVEHQEGDEGPRDHRNRRFEGGRRSRQRIEFADHRFAPDADIDGEEQIAEVEIAVEQAAVQADQRGDDGHAPEKQHFHDFLTPG